MNMLTADKLAELTKSLSAQRNKTQNSQLDFPKFYLDMMKDLSATKSQLAMYQYGHQTAEDIVRDNFTGVGFTALSLPESIGVCKSFEPALRKLGVHVSLTGSTLYGMSEGKDDLDLLLYRDGKKPIPPAIDILLSLNKELGIALRCVHNFPSSENFGKEIAICRLDLPDGRFCRIDFIIIR